MDFYQNLAYFAVFVLNHLVEKYYEKKFKTETRFTTDAYSYFVSYYYFDYHIISYLWIEILNL